MKVPFSLSYAEGGPSLLDRAILVSWVTGQPNTLRRQHLLIRAPLMRAMPTITASLVCQSFLGVSAIAPRMLLQIAYGTGPVFACVLVCVHVCVFA